MMNNTEIEQKVTSAFEDYFEAKVTDSDSFKYMVENVIEICKERKDNNLDHLIQYYLKFITSHDSHAFPIHSRMMIHQDPSIDKTDLDHFLDTSCFKFRLADSSFFRKSNSEQSEYHQTILKFYAKRHEYFTVSTKQPTLKAGLAIRNQELFEALVGEWFPTASCPLLKKALILATAWYYKPKRKIAPSEFSNVLIPSLPEKFISSVVVFCYLILFGKPENIEKVSTGLERHFHYSDSFTIFDLLKEEQEMNLIVKIMYIFTDESPITFFKKMVDQQYFPINFMERFEKQLENLQEENRNFHKTLGEKIKKVEEVNKNLGEKIKKVEEVNKNLKAENKLFGEKIKKLENDNKFLVEKVEKLEGENKFCKEIRR